MAEVFISAATRTAIGRKNGSLSAVHSTDLLARVLTSAVGRAGVPPHEVGQALGGCVSQVGMQSFNVTRTGWLNAGLPESVPATTIDSQCGSSQQAANLAAQIVRAGGADVVIACGVENMSSVPLGSTIGEGVGKYISRSYFKHWQYTSQFEAAELIAEKWGIDRAATDELAYQSQTRAARAIAEGRFASQITSVEVLSDPGLDASGTSRRFEVDECLRPTTIDGLASLTPIVRPDGVHTAGSSSQIADAAGAIVLASESAVNRLGLPVMARVIDTAFVGTDPMMMLTAPIDATRLLLTRNRLGINDIDVIENNEAFASVVLAWNLELAADPERLNPNGGAIALGHALGSTGVILLTKALYELERSEGKFALITMCCGGGLATATLIERL